jgi:hypothetical protein
MAMPQLSTGALVGAVSTENWQGYPIVLQVLGTPCC